MARKVSRISRGPASSFSEGDLNKGHLRKLNALRKSVGHTIGTRAFSQWLGRQASRSSTPRDENAEAIVNALKPLVMTGNLRVRRGGYLVKRGRGRVIVTPAKAH